SFLRVTPMIVGTRQTMNRKSAALVGGLLMAPFVAANAIVGNRIEPFFSFIRPGLHTSAFEYVLLVLVLGCLPVGAFIAARPMLERGADGRRRIYLLNAILAAFMVVVFVILSAGLAADIYRCDVLQIPNCD
ncbi:MAG: hypothetical protein ACREJC_22420, partial [Tepidisphaeraceae bacterium]